MTLGRRGFLGRIVAAGTASVLAGYIDDETTGLAVPDRSIEIARDVPPDPIVIGASLTRLLQLHSGMTMGQFDHTRAHNGDGTIVVLVNGELWGVPAFKIPPGHSLGRPEIRTL